MADLPDTRYIRSVPGLVGLVCTVSGWHIWLQLLLKCGSKYYNYCLSRSVSGVYVVSWWSVKQPRNRPVLSAHKQFICPPLQMYTVCVSRMPVFLMFCMCLTCDCVCWYNLICTRSIWHCVHNLLTHYLNTYDVVLLSGSVNECLLFSWLSWY